VLTDASEVFIVNTVLYTIYSYIYSLVFLILICRAKLVRLCLWKVKYGIFNQLWSILTLLKIQRQN